MTRLEQFLYPPFIIAGMVNCVSKVRVLITAVLSNA